jgi:uncharacterized repeat protein (TIGR03803 family)
MLLTIRISVDRRKDSFEYRIDTLMKVSKMKEIGLARVVSLVAVFCIVGVVWAPAQTFQTPVTFNSANGAVPTDVLVQGTDGNLYGTTQYGGAANLGTVFKLTQGGALTTIYSFCSKSLCTDGSLPDAGLVQASNGNFYGTTFWGGSQDSGTIFKVTASGVLTTLHSFCSLARCADGTNPHAALTIGSDGNFYGTMSKGGATNGGGVFKLTPGGTFTVLYSFCSQSNCTDGSTPQGSLIQWTDGSFYGTTSAGGNADAGTVFKLTPGGVLTTLYTFCSLAKCADGEFPYAGLALGSDGNFYGTTSGSAPLTGGTVFKITPSGLLTTLHRFCSLADCADGEYPFAGVVQGTDGNFYGTTEIGGANTNTVSCGLGCGTFFRITPSGTLATLYNFCSNTSCSDGAESVAGVVQASNGTFYGTTFAGGSCLTLTEGCGTVFTWSTKVPLPPTFLPSSVDFGYQAIDTTSTTKTVAIKNGNTGYSILDLSSIKVSGNRDFAISSSTCGPTLAAGKACKVSLTFTPTSLGAESATLNVFDNAPGSPQTVPMSGTGTAQAVVTPTSLTFAKQKVGTTSGAKKVTLKNKLNTNLTGISYAATKPFAVSDSTCKTTLAINSSCTISVVFKPTVTGTVTGTLTIKDSANNSPQIVSLTGTGN